jgi:hypothetical protein
MEGRDCERVNLFLRQNPGLSRDVDRNSPLVSCQDAERLCTAARRLGTVAPSTAANGTALNGTATIITAANGSVANGTAANGTVPVGTMENGTAESSVGEHTKAVTDSVPDINPVKMPDTQSITFEVKVPNTVPVLKVAETKPQDKAYYSTCTDSSSDEETKPQLPQDTKELIEPDPDEPAAPQQRDKFFSTCTDASSAQDIKPPTTVQVSGQKRHMDDAVANTNVPCDVPHDVPNDMQTAPPAKKKHQVVERAHKMKVARQKTQWYMRHSANRPQIDLSGT